MPQLLGVGVLVGVSIRTWHAGMLLLFRQQVLDLNREKGLLRPHAKRLRGQINPHALFQPLIAVAGGWKLPCPHHVRQAQA